MLYNSHFYSPSHTDAHSSLALPQNHTIHLGCMYVGIGVFVPTLLFPTVQPWYAYVCISFIMIMIYLLLFWNNMIYIDNWYDIYISSTYFHKRKLLSASGSVRRSVTHTRCQKKGLYTLCSFSLCFQCTVSCSTTKVHVDVSIIHPNAYTLAYVKWRTLGEIEWSH